MTVDEFLVELYNDELSDVFAGNRNAKVESRPKLLPLINTGMNYAYATYKINFTTTQLVVTADLKAYTLPETDILAITAIYNSYGRELEATEVSILGKELYFPVPDNVELQVEYKTKPTKFTVAQDDTAVQLVLPDLLIPWLRAYVASRYFASMKTDEAVGKSVDFQNQATRHEQIYQMTNTTNEYSSASNNRLGGRGFA